MAPSQIPHLRSTELSKQLIVNDEPLLMLAGELQNSSFTSADSMKEQWPKLKAANLNTILGCITWEQFEPEEGIFHAEELEELILDARTFGMRLVLLWFGSFKNGLSSYTPSWVKLNPKRFPRAEIQTLTNEAKVINCLSLFGEEAQQADAVAFRNLMQHIKRTDEEHSTVIMVQAENEVGLLGDSRDRNALAVQRFHEPVPAPLSEWRERGFKRDITWAQIPGSGVHIDELFMAYHYALYLNTVTEAGKQVYPLPMFTNVWQNYSSADRDKNLDKAVLTVLDAAGGSLPGHYPSGGANDTVIDIWQTFAPRIYFISPDVYLNDYEISCKKYRHRGQPLFIPEQRRDEYGARRIWTAYFSYQALGAAPFGIDTLSPEENPFRRHYGLLASVAPIVLKAQTRTNASFRSLFDELNDDGTDPSEVKRIDMAGWNLTIERFSIFRKPSAGSGAVVHLQDNQFLLLGWGLKVTSKSLDARAYFNGLLRFEEKEVVNSKTGELRTLRHLNGDETRSGKCAVMPSENPDYGVFPIAITIPAPTGIALVQPYALLSDDKVSSRL